MALFKKNTEDEYGEQTKRGVNVPSLLTLIVIVALIVIFALKFWNTEEETSDVDLPPLASATPAPLDKDEYPGLFSENIISDIKYVLTSKEYKRENMKEQTLFQALDGIRKVYGRQSDFNVSVAFIDSELCSNSRDAIAYFFTCKDNKGLHQIELRIEFGVMTGSDGFADYYATSATFVEK